MSQTSDPDAKLANLESPAIQGLRLLATLEAAKDAAARAAAGQKSANALGSRQQHALEAVHEVLQNLFARGRDLRNSLQLVHDSVDRAKLAALNAGLEGARLGEPVGKALVVLGDEVRNLLARAQDALEGHTTLLAEVEHERERQAAELQNMRENSQELERTLTQSENQTELIGTLLLELRTDLNRLIGTDPEIARLIASSTGQVHTLTNSLLELSRHSTLSAGALRELLAPLFSLVASRDPEREQ